MRAAASIAFGLCLLGQQALTSQQSKPEDKNSPTQEKPIGPIEPGKQPSVFTFKNKLQGEGCIYVSEEGNLYFTYWGNNCNMPMQFTIRWYGGAPPRDITYRTNSRGYVRRLIRQDTTGELVDEKPAELGLGEYTDRFGIQETSIGHGETLLSIVNGENQPVYIDGFISIRKNGHEVEHALVGVLVDAADRVRVAKVYSGATYVYVLNGEKDPS